MLRIHRAERADRLAAALAAVLARPLDDPLRTEVVAVPTRGVERWLGQRLSECLGASPGRSDGVCANVEFPFPGRLVGGAVAVAAGVDREADPWLPERAAWPLLHVVEEGLDEPWLAPLAAHLGRTGPDPDEHRRARRLSVVRHVADLFDRYGVHRPAMLRSWAAGVPAGAAGWGVPADAAWQPELWRRLRARIGAPSPAERLTDACARLRADPALVDLPGRLSLFGLTRLPASYLDVLRALAAAREVHLFLLHPSPALWARVGEAPERRPRVVRRAEDRTAALPRNPLLATWGRDAREMQVVLAAGADRLVEEHHPLELAPRTLLERIQADVRADRPPPGPPLPGEEDRRPQLDPDDGSLRVHACHGRARQVEVVRDAVLHLLADDPGLEPRDVIVMCPDIESFAPLVHATFGVGAGDGEGGDDGEGRGGEGRLAGGAAPDLRVRLADRSLRQTNPVLGAVSELLALAAARLTASELVDFASREPVRRRFGFDDDGLARIEGWVAAAGVRWGLDGAHRRPFGLEAVGANTWRSGLDRLLLGVTMGEEGRRLVGGVLPLDGVDSGDVELAGSLAELVDRLHAAVGALSSPKPVDEWVVTIAEAADALTATTETDAWQRAQLQRLLDDVVAEAGAEGGPGAAPLVLDEVRALLADRLRGRPTRANFRTGHLTMCTLVPMRSVPHRVVCLLGLDDGVFPRRTAPDGDDLVERDPHVGDRDPRSEDRQLLLDALLAASDHLVVTYTGRDERTNAVRPPAVPVGELLDVVDATVRAGDRPARQRVVVHHPLQPFDVRNFAAGAVAGAGPWSFDPVALDGARASVSPRAPAPAFLPRPLPPAAADVVQLEDLVRFVQHPTKAFLRQRLGVVLGRDEEDPADALPVELGPLERWAVGQRLLDARLAGVGAVACRAAELARGSLPPGALGAPALDVLLGEVEDIVREAERAAGAGAEPQALDAVVELGDGRVLVGTVPGVVGDVVRTVTFSRVAPKHRLAAWARLLALAAAHPERPLSALTVGRGSGPGVAVVRIGALGRDPAGRRRAALAHLGVLVDLHDRGMREPLPLCCTTSAAWAEARAAGRDPVAAARRAWTGDREHRLEDHDPEHRLVLGAAVPVERLLEAPPSAGEAGPGWAADEATRFGRCARRLWDGLLASEERSRR